MIKNNRYDKKEAQQISSHLKNRSKSKVKIYH